MIVALLSQVGISLECITSLGILTALLMDLPRVAQFLYLVKLRIALVAEGSLPRSQICCGPSFVARREKKDHHTLLEAAMNVRMVSVCLAVHVERMLGI